MSIQPKIAPEAGAITPPMVTQMLQSLELADSQMAAQFKEREEALVLLTQRLDSRIEMLTKENAALRVQLETPESLQRETEVLNKGEADSWKNTAETAQAEIARLTQLHKQETDALKGHIKLLVDAAHASAAEVAKKSKTIQTQLQTKITAVNQWQTLAPTHSRMALLQAQKAAELSDLQSIAQNASDIASQADLLSKLEVKK